VRNVFRRPAWLEARVIATTVGAIVIRILLVHPEKGVTGVLVLENDKPTIKVTPTAEEVERVRADLERRRAARLAGKEGTRDTHDWASA